MPLHLTQVAYTPEGWKSLVKNPHNRLDDVRSAIAGGSCKSVKTTPRMTAAEGIEALKQTARSGYRPVTAAAGAATVG
jgi:hypothetical protein